MEQNFTCLDWDSDFFGFRVARIMLTDANKDQLAETLDMLRQEKFRLAYWFLPDSQQASLIAKANGGILADEKVTYLKELSTIEGKSASPIYSAVPFTGAESDDALADLALQSGEYSRFRLDPLFPRDKFEKLYRCWITRSVNKDIAWEVLVVKERDVLLGLVTLGTKGDRGDIGLLAVSEQARGKGIGRTLVLDADRAFAYRGLAVAQVVTQRCNLGACKLYESCGYRIEKIEKIFHFWL